MLGIEYWPWIWTLICRPIVDLYTSGIQTEIQDNAAIATKVNLKSEKNLLKLFIILEMLPIIKSMSKLVYLPYPDNSIIRF